MMKEQLDFLGRYTEILVVNFNDFIHIFPIFYKVTIKLGNRASVMRYARPNKQHNGVSVMHYSFLPTLMYSKFSEVIHSMKTVQQTLYHIFKGWKRVRIVQWQSISSCDHIGSGLANPGNYLNMFFAHYSDIQTLNNEMEQSYIPFYSCYRFFLNPIDYVLSQNSAHFQNKKTKKSKRAKWGMLHFHS